ncbi:MAG TPA: hypothetical protein VD995_21020 [Azospirillum sp.]|nr:hypothetical protein [Azospirillum sp.]
MEGRRRQRDTVAFKALGKLRHWRRTWWADLDLGLFQVDIGL